MMHPLEEKFHFIQSIRNFFLEKGFLDIITPPVVENPGMEVHIHPFSLYSEINQKKIPLYLHSSPEFKIKEFLSHYPKDSEKKVFNINYCFRDEPNSPNHRSQFIMLEWYRLNSYYSKISEDIKDLIKYLQPNKKIIFHEYTIQEIFLKFLNIDILEFNELKDIKKLVQDKFPNLLLNQKEDLPWEDYFWLIFLNHIEPNLSKYEYLILKEFPAPLSALSSISKKDNRVCERFEFFIDGLEIANCFNELLDYKTHEERFKEQETSKREIYNYTLPKAQSFLDSIQKGLPPCSGIALGVERLYKKIKKTENIFWD